MSIPFSDVELSLAGKALQSRLQASLEPHCPITLGDEVVDFDPARVRVEFHKSQESPGGYIGEVKAPNLQYAREIMHGALTANLPSLSVYPEGKIRLFDACTITFHPTYNEILNLSRDRPLGQNITGSTGSPAAQHNRGDDLVR